MGQTERVLPEGGVGITLVPDSAIWDQWATVSPMLEKAVKGSAGRWTMQLLLQDLINHKQQLWIAYSKEEAEVLGAATTSIQQYPGRRMLNIQFLGGEAFADYESDGFEVLSRFAKDTGCDGIEMIARPGFKRKPYVRDKKFETPHILYETFF